MSAKKITPKRTARKGTQKPTTHKCPPYTEQAQDVDRRIEAAEKRDEFNLILAAKRKDIEARAAYDLLHVGAPDFIIHALTTSIDAAAKSRNLSAPTYANDETETEAQAIEKIADIFTVAYDYKPTDPESLTGLAGHIAAVLAHPRIPAKLYNDISSAVMEFQNSCIDYTAMLDSAEVIEKSLTMYAENETKRQKGGAR